MNDDSKDFQKKLAYTQIYYGGIIAIGCTFLAIGVSILILSLSVLDDLVTNGDSILNLDALNSLSQFFAIIGAILIVFGLSAPTLRWSKAKEKNKNSDCCTACDNPLPCPIHENKSSPI